MTLVSVIVPAYNAESTIMRAVNSALNQTHDRLEVIVVDDGSSDSTSEIVRSVDDQRVTLLARDQPSGGPAAPRNLALGVARGDWLAMLDADDSWLPSKLERQLDVASDSDALIYSRCTLRTADSDRDYHDDLGIDRLPAGLCADELVRINFVPCLTALVRREWMTSTGPFNQRLIGSADWEYWLRISLQGGHFRPVDEPLAIYHWHDTNISHHTDWAAEHLALFRTLRKAFPQHRDLIKPRLDALRRKQRRKQLLQLVPHPVLRLRRRSPT